MRGVCRASQPFIVSMKRAGSSIRKKWLEFSNTTPLPAKIYANEGVAQVLFFESDEVCETSYKDRGGKYQGQVGVTLPKI